MPEKKDRKMEPGSTPPAFSLPDQDGKTVKLSEYKGKWLVLYFYPNDDTPGCTTEACDFTNGLKDFEKLDAAVVGCSPNSLESHQKFIAKYKLKVRLLSDPEHEAMAAYGAWGDKVLYGKKTDRRHPLDGDRRPERQGGIPLGDREICRPRRRCARKAERAAKRLT